MTSLLRKKDINALISHASPLKRTLRTWDLTFLGIGAIIGTGIFVNWERGPYCRTSPFHFIFDRGTLLRLCWPLLC